MPAPMLVLIPEHRPKASISKIHSPYWRASAVMSAVNAASSSGGLGGLALSGTMLAENPACLTFGHLQFIDHMIHASAATGGA